MTSLVIVESEAKAKALAEQSGGVHETLLLRSAPMTVSHQSGAAKLSSGETGFQFVPTEAERDFAKGLLTKLHKDIYVALESDQRGEYWSWMLNKFAFAASKGQKGIMRIHVSGFAGEELAESFRLVEPVQDSLAASLYIRSLFNNCLQRHLYRLLGTVNGPGGLPLDFTSLTALFLLEERQAEVNAFSAPTKWQVRARLSTPAGPVTAGLQEAYGISDDGFFRDAAEVKKALALFEGQSLAVKGVTESDLIIEPPMPYQLAELLQDASILLGMGPAKVLHTLQRFYAGLVIDGSHIGIISVPFSVVSCQLQVTLARIRKEVATVFGEGELIERQPSGHVILPLFPDLNGDHLQAVLSAEERELYDLIRCRALASQMPQATGRNLLMECAAAGCLFEGRGTLLIEKGFLKTFARGYEHYLSRACPLQDLQDGQQLSVEQVIPEQSAGVTADYYTFESLCEDLGEFSVPLDSTLILMLQEMLVKGYLAVNDRGGLHLEGNADKVVATLNRAFPAMKGINLSAYFEQTVNEVVSGRKPLDFALKQFDQNFVMHGVPLVKIQVPRSVPLREKKSKNIIKSPEPASVRPASMQEPAPLQEAATADLPVIDEAAGEGSVVAVEETSQIAASEEERTFAPSPEPAEAMVEEKAEESSLPAEDAEVVAGKDDEPPAETKVVAAEEMPAGDSLPDEAVVELAGETADTAMETVQATQQEAVFEEPQGTTAEEGGEASAEVVPVDVSVDEQMPLEAQMDLPCPLCGQESLVVKRTPTGKELYVCSKEGCEFMAWSRPHDIDCPQCGSPFLVEKKMGERTVLRCPKAGCSYYQNLDQDEGEMQEAASTESGEPRKKKILVRRKKAGGSGVGGGKKVVVRRVKR